MLAPLHRWQEVYTQLGVSTAAPCKLCGEAARSVPAAHVALFPGLVMLPFTPEAPLPCPDSLPCFPGLIICPESLACLLPPQARFRELESTRLELDSRRRTVAELSHK